MTTTTTTATATQAELDAQAYQALQDADGNATKAAAALGMVRSTFQNRIKRHAARTAQDEAAEPDFRFIQPSHHGSDGQPPAADTEQASPFVADPANPTDGELAAAVERGLADGTLVDAADVMARLETELAGADDTETPAPAADAQPARVNWTRQAGRKNIEVNFPEGVITPAAFRHALISETLAPGTLRIQGVYNMLGRKGFPVRHYDADGGVYDAPQDRDGARVTRPGVDLAAARAWYLAKQS